MLAASLTAKNISARRGQCFTRVIIAVLNDDTKYAIESPLSYWQTTITSGVKSLAGSIWNKAFSKNVAIDDPYDLNDRFIPKHKGLFEQALKEINAGKKRGHWSWYFFPTAPYINERGEEKGSAENKKYALRDLPPNEKQGIEACKAYLKMPTIDGVNLRNNYIRMMDAIKIQLEQGVLPLNLVSNHLFCSTSLNTKAYYKKNLLGGKN